MAVAIVDDDESICRALARLLRQHGLRPGTFQSCEEFLASPLRKEVGCVVVDIQLRAGSMSGLELRRAMAESGDDTPVVFLSARDDAETQAEASRIGGIAFFRKGTNPTLLVELLMKVERGE